jgi:hypothetical protein
VSVRALSNGGIVMDWRPRIADSSSRIAVQLFIRMHNEALTVVAMRICNPDRSLVGIKSTEGNDREKSLSTCGPFASRAWDCLKGAEPRIAGPSLLCRIGPVAFFMKPFDDEKFIAAVRDALNQSLSRK